MKYCAKCGRELFDEAIVCPGCGCYAGPVKSTPKSQGPTYSEPKRPSYSNEAPKREFESLYHPPEEFEASGKQEKDFAIFDEYETFDNLSEIPTVELSPLKIIAKIFMIIGTAVSGLYILPLAWCLPMTLVYCHKIKKGKPISVGFKVCSLIFVSLVGGILMLCDDDKNKTTEV